MDSPPLPPVDAALTTELQLQVQTQYRHHSLYQRLEGREGGDSEVEVQMRLSHICSYVILSELTKNEMVAPALQVFLLQAVEMECEGEELRLLAKKEIVSVLIKPGVQHMMNVSSNSCCIAWHVGVSEVHSDITTYMPLVLSSLNRKPCSMIPVVYTLGTVL